MRDRAKEHWNRVYDTKRPEEVSWFQAIPERSLELVKATGAAPSAPVIDVGGGASTLVDRLLDAGYRDLTVLDISDSALERSRARLGALAARIEWIESDVLDFRPLRSYAIWHDRAVFHFLTQERDRRRYLQVLQAALEPGGHLLLATFGPGGPERCSGLPVRRSSIEDLELLLGERFALRRHQLEEHRTPSGGAQEFLYGWWQKR